MTYRKAVVANITRNTTAAQGATFNFPLFAASHKYYKEVVRSYSSFESVRSDTAIPTNSNTYNALRLAFSQTPAPQIVFVGKRQADSITLTPVDSVEDKVYGFTLTVVNTTTGASETPVVVAYTAEAAATPTTITTAWTTALSGVAEINTTGTTALSITADSGYDFIVNGLVNASESYVSTESAADLLASIQAENNDWYFMCAEDHSEAFQLAMAAEIEATGNDDFPKMYFTSTNDSNSIVALPDPAIDVIGKLKELGYNRTVCDWHDQADSLFPEMGLVGANGTYQPGGINWKFTQINGIDAAADPITGIRLSTNKQGFIEDRNGGWMGVEKGINFYHEGKVVSGEWIDKYCLAA